jgi:hypothetical protein
MGKSVKIKDLSPCFEKSGVKYSAFSEIQNLLANAIKISNVDFTTEAIIKRYLFDGYVGYDKIRGVWCNVYGAGINKQGNPTQLIFVYENGETFTRPAYYEPNDFGAYIIKATPLPFSFNNMINYTTNVMQECDKTIIQNLEAIRAPFIAVLKNEELKLSLEHAIEQKQDGKPVVLVSPELGDAMQGIEIKTNYVVDKIASFKYDERDRLLNKIGIMSANTDKRERVQVGEVNATLNQCTDYIYLLIDTFNQQMKDYNLPFKMSFNGALEELYLQNEKVEEVNEIEKGTNNE